MKASADHGKGGGDGLPGADDHDDDAAPVVTREHKRAEKEVLSS